MLNKTSIATGRTNCNRGGVGPDASTVPDGPREVLNRGRRRDDTRLRSDAQIPTADELRRLYIDEQLSSGEIARRCGVSAQWVLDRLRENGIPPRPRNVARHGLDPAKLRNLYLEQGMSIEEIAARYQRSSSTILALLHTFDIALRPHLPDLGAEVLRSLYVDQGLGVREVARRLGIGRQSVRRHLDVHGIPIHAARRTPWPGPDLLADLYTDQALEVAQIAARLERSPQHIATLLDRYAIARRPPPGPVAPAISEQVLVDLYVDQGLSVAAVGSRLGRSEHAVAAALRYHGLGPRPRRSANHVAPIDPKTVIELYVEHKLPLGAVAVRLSSSKKRVRDVLADHNISLRSGPARIPPPQLDAETLTDLYVRQRLDHSAIAARHAVTPYQVIKRLQELDIRRPRAGGNPKLSPPVEELKDLYIRQALPVTEVGRRYDVVEETARRWIQQAGLPVRPRTTRASRRQLPVDRVGELYVDQGLTSVEVAAALGVANYRNVLRTLHDNALPVRNSGVRPAQLADSEHITLLRLLYADPDVLAALASHGLPRRPRPGPLATRFPTPAPLTAALLERLYTTIGLAAYHIELLTGQPAERVLDTLHAQGIAVRTRLGASPWLRRQRARTPR